MFLLAAYNVNKGSKSFFPGCLIYKGLVFLLLYFSNIRNLYCLVASSFAASEVCADTHLERLDLVLTIFFLNPVTLSLLLTVLQITLIALGSSNKDKGRMCILVLEKIAVSPASPVL